jgi:hypothetical protein
MKYLIILFPILYLTSLYSQSVNYIWVGDKRGPYKGECYKVDAETGGKSFKAKVKNVECKPNKTDYLFVSSKSRCYEIDSETNGKQYVHKIDVKLCKPEKTIIAMYQINGKSGCYIMDKKTKGEYFHKKLLDKKCISSKENKYSFSWEYKERGKGICYKVSSSLGKEVKQKTKNEDCKTSKTFFLFKKTRETSGICIEEDAEDPIYYSTKVKVERCKPSETVFVFHTPKRSKTGKCFEIDLETKGKDYINKVDTDLCSPE